MYDGHAREVRRFRDKIANISRAYSSELEASPSAVAWVRPRSSRAPAACASRLPLPPWIRCANNKFR
jgi:hypothetical protein